MLFHQHTWCPSSSNPFISPATWCSVFLLLLGVGLQHPTDVLSLEGPENALLDARVLTNFADCFACHFLPQGSATDVLRNWGVPPPVSTTWASSHSWLIYVDPTFHGMSWTYSWVEVNKGTENGKYQKFVSTPNSSRIRGSLKLPSHVLSMCKRASPGKGS